jgi:hypothetical protein
MKRWHQFACFVVFGVLGAQWTWLLFKPTEQPGPAQQRQNNTGIKRNAVSELFGGPAAGTDNSQSTGFVTTPNGGLKTDPRQVDQQPVHSVLPNATAGEVRPQYVMLADHGMFRHVDIPDHVKSPSLTPTDARMSSPPVPVQAAVGPTPQVLATAPNMVIHPSAENAGSPQISYIQPAASVHAPNMVLAPNAGKVD